MIMQRNTDDCGVATVANACGVSYEEALRAVHPSVKEGDLSRRFRTTYSQIEEAVWRLTGRRTVRGYPERWVDVPEGAIATLRFEDEDEGYHWVMKERGTGRVLDPQAGPHEFGDDPTARICRYVEQVWSVSSGVGGHGD